MSLSVVTLCLAFIIGMYFYNNPLRHSGWYVFRRFTNWLPLGMTYAFLYMGRYNLNVSKNAMGSLMSNEDFGLIFAAGTWTYALSFLVNGPFVDKIGGKKGIMIAALGAAAANVALGVVTYLVLMHRLHIKLVLVFSIIYALNMYFQSYGAVSIIKVKAYWFHVRERGVFGAIFGTLISLGVYFAFDWGQAIVDMTKARAGAQPSWLELLIRKVFALDHQTVDATWCVFFIPAILLAGWALLDLWLIKDTPEQAGFPPFETHDASTGLMHVQYSMTDLLKKVFASPLMLMLALVELTSGVSRNGIMQWYPIFAKQVKQTGAEAIADHWGLWLCLFGIVGGFAGGLISDKLFQSRRGPPTALLCGLILLMAGGMALVLFRAPWLVGIASLIIVMAAIGVTSLTSGTAAADFGGRKATATCSGIVDGFVYLGSGLQSISLGFLTGNSWIWWPLFLMPFAVLGCGIAIRFWNELPAATRKYLAEVENNPAAAGAGHTPERVIVPVQPP
ncbi:MAG TPA: MFS transporter [Verrucomicrobiae bacterium]|nr:MFS transporter [Verrucomicrobiae bacterium]